MIRLTVAVATVGAMVWSCGREGRKETPPPAADAPPRVSISAPAEGTVFAAGDSVRITLTVDHLTLAPAGTDQPGTGHHHLLINQTLADSTQPVPTDSGFVHLGKAQTEYVMPNVAAGSYTVIAVLGDHLHVPIPGQVRDTVHFEVR